MLRHQPERLGRRLLLVISHCVPVVSHDTSAITAISVAASRSTTPVPRRLHAMGFWHAGAVNDVMFPGTGNYYDATLSAREKYHVALAYSRPVGNRDPDDDSQTSVILSLPRVTVY
jgi:hypothetical protein